MVCFTVAKKLGYKSCDSVHLRNIKLFMFFQFKQYIHGKVFFVCKDVPQKQRYVQYIQYKEKEEILQIIK